MPGRAASLGAWWLHLEPSQVRPRKGEADDPRLGDVAARWSGGEPTLAAGRPVLVGFPSDQEARRGHDQPGAANAPDAIREELFRFTTWDPVARLALPSFLDLGNVVMDASLEASQERLAAAVAGLLLAGAVPILMGGGHETALGHFHGYARARVDCAILNIDAHLDVRPHPHGGHGGSAFRQALEHARPPARYVVVGAQRQAAARAHEEFVLSHEGRIHWLTRDLNPLAVVELELEALLREARNVLVTVDAGAFRQSEVPGTSQPGPAGLAAGLWPELGWLCGRLPQVRSIELSGIHPALDREGHSARWAALGLRQFLAGLETRNR